MAVPPLLLNDLTEVEQLNLASLTQHPGFPALEKLFMAACRRATDEFMRLDPSAERYEQQLKYSQWKARDRREFSQEVLMSILYHTKVTELRAEEKNQEPPKNPYFSMPDSTPAKENKQ